MIFSSLVFYFVDCCLSTIFNVTCSPYISSEEMLEFSLTKGEGYGFDPIGESGSL
jgi:hypothetical protein